MPEHPIAAQIRKVLSTTPEHRRQGIVDELLGVIRQLNPRARVHPVDSIRWVPVSQVVANDYNPNTVATKEMSLLRTSVLADGITQPIVSSWDPELQKYVVVDGFHRFFLVKKSPEVRDKTQGLVPVVVLEKTLAERMASTIRHNRARGTHSVGGMSKLVLELKEKGVPDAQICAELGMETDELRRLMTVTGYALLYEGVEFSRSWRTEGQIKLAKEFRERTPRRIAEIVGKKSVKDAGDSAKKVRKRMVMCTKCRCRERVEGKSHCQSCIDKTVERSNALKKRRKEREEKGLCNSCGKRPVLTGRKTCLACSLRRGKYRKKKDVTPGKQNQSGSTGTGAPAMTS